jgi:hypothetical protein
MIRCANLLNGNGHFPLLTETDMFLQEKGIFTIFNDEIRRPKKLKCSLIATTKICCTRYTVIAVVEETVQEVVNSLYFYKTLG